MADNKLYLSYNQVHKLCQGAAPQILQDMAPNLMIAIGGGGYVPARILRSFLKRPGSANIPIQAIGLSLYEKISGSSGTKTTNGTNGVATTIDDDGPEEQLGTHVKRTQWLDLSALEMTDLVGKRILIVDEVDDTRTTLEYAVRELERDIAAAARNLGKKEGVGETQFSVFVLHNKNKPKKGSLPNEMMTEGRYLAARTVDDVWICYPWEATDIDEHDRLAAAQADGR